MSSLGSRRQSLRTLPNPAAIPGDPWSLLTTKQVAQLLGVDPATLTVWKYRGLGPECEPPYFKGSVQAYRLDKVLMWLGQRRDEKYNVEQAWADALWRLIHPMDGHVPELVARWVEMSGERLAAPAGARWRSGGFQAYVASLAATQL